MELEEYKLLSKVRYPRKNEEEQIQASFIHDMQIIHGENGKNVMWWSIPNGNQSKFMNIKNKRTGTLAGMPDIQIIKKGKPPLFLEFKSLKGRVSQDQLLRHEQLRKHGSIIHVVRSSEEALMKIALWLDFN